MTLGVTPEWRTAGREMLGFAFALLSSEVDQVLGKIFAIGGEEPLPHSLDVPLATEYRLLIHYGGRGGMEGIEARSLGVVNEDFAFHKRDEMLRDLATNVIVEARRVVRGEWGQVVRR